jgi:hypothetical protein
MSGDSRPTLQVELDRLIDQFGEANVVATLKALTKRPRGRPPEDAVQALLCMAWIVGVEWPERISLAGRGRNLTPYEKSVSLAAKRSRRWSPGMTQSTEKMSRKIFASNS